MSFQVVDAFDFPVPVWNETRASYRVEEAPGRRSSGKSGTSGFGAGSAGSSGSNSGYGGVLHTDDPDAQAGIARARLAMIGQRLRRSEAFASAARGAGRCDMLFGVEWVSLDSLLGNPGRKCVVAILSQLVEREWFLEDLSNRNVKVNLLGAQVAPGLITEGAVVIAIGRYSDVDARFEVEQLTLPPPEPRLVSIDALGSVDLFMPRAQVLETEPDENVSLSYSGSIGRPRKSKYAGKIAAADVSTTSRTERNNSHGDSATAPADAEFVVLSDVHLDVPEVLQKLESIFREYASDPPTAVIMFGNFLARQERHESSSTAASALQEAFGALAELLSGFAKIAKTTHFVFVPGPADGGHTADVLPHHPIPRIFTKDLREKVRHCHFSTNPCRIRYFKIDICLFREDLVTKLRRNARATRQQQVQQTEGPIVSAVSQDVVQTIVDAGHLCPLTLPFRPIYWKFDHCLWLYPLPDAVICADSFDAYEHKYSGCLVLNPGSFVSDFSFVQIFPHDLDSEEGTSFCRA